MYGLPENFDASFLIGSTLEMIGLTINQVYLHFGNNIMITIEGQFLHQLYESDFISVITEPPLSESSLMPLMEHSVTKAWGDKEGTLTIVFDNGHVFKCFDDPHYESYHIKNGEHEITV